MERYETYKPSGISWIGEIPSHWEMRRNKYLFKEEEEKNSDLSFQLLTFSRKKGIVPFSDANEKAPSASDLSNYKIIRSGQLLENRMQAWSGMFAKSEIDGCVSPDYSVFSPTSDIVSVDYFAFLFRTNQYIAHWTNLSRGVGEGFNRLYTNQFHSVYVLFPPYNEQRKIVEYLSTKISQINAQQRERELRLLDKLKQAEIANVVTRGLNPDVPMKDSGIFWHPYIPANWSVHKLKYILTRLDRNREPNSELLICSNSGKVFPRGEAKLGLVSDDETIYQGVKAGDLLIHGMDTWHGAVGISDYDGMCTPVVHVCDSKENKKFIYYYLRYMAYQKVFKLISNGVRQNTSDFRSWDKLASILIPIPPIEEQNAIVAYIESKDSAIDEMIANLRAEIEFLTEYKQRLIADVVRGQINVQNI